MRYGIPNYRVPEEKAGQGYGRVLEWGIEFRGNTTIGKDITMDQLKKDFDAIFLATGANGSARIPLEGADKTGVSGAGISCGTWRSARTPTLKGDVIVVGGGNVAIDVALTAKRLGAAMFTSSAWKREKRCRPTIGRSPVPKRKGSSSTTPGHPRRCWGRQGDGPRADQVHLCL